MFSTGGFKGFPRAPKFHFPRAIAAPNRGGVSLTNQFQTSSARPPFHGVFFSRQVQRHHRTGPHRWYLAFVFGHTRHWTQLFIRRLCNRRQTLADNVHRHGSAVFRTHRFEWQFQLLVGQIVEHNGMSIRWHVRLTQISLQQKAGVRVQHSGGVHPPLLRSFPHPHRRFNSSYRLNVNFYHRFISWQRGNEYQCRHFNRGNRVHFPATHRNFHVNDRFVYNFRRGTPSLRRRPPSVNRFNTVTQTIGRRRVRLFFRFLRNMTGYKERTSRLVHHHHGATPTVSHVRGP